MRKKSEVPPSSWLVDEEGAGGGDPEAPSPTTRGKQAKLPEPSPPAPSPFAEAKGEGVRNLHSQPPPRSQTKTRKGLRRRNLLIALAFLAPNLLGFLVFTAGPMFVSLGASFTNWDLQRSVPLRFNGAENYRTMLADEHTWVYFANTLYFMLGMPIGIALSLFLAIVLNQKLRGMTTYRVLLYLPTLTSGVAVMILWKALYNPDFGPINQVIEAITSFLHLPFQSPTWLASTNNVLGLGAEKVSFSSQNLGLGARDALILMGLVTGIGGGNMLLYLAALTNMPEELVEAAQIDGGGRWAVFKHVVWPQLAPTTFFIVVMGTIGGLQGGFETARVMTNGGPGGTTTTLGYHIYTKAFEEFQIGYASAVSWVLFALIFIVTALNWRFGNKEGGYA